METWTGWPGCGRWRSGSSITGWSPRLTRPSSTSTRWSPTCSASGRAKPPPPGAAGEDPDRRAALVGALAPAARHDEPQQHPAPTPGRLGASGLPRQLLRLAAQCLRSAHPTATTARRPCPDVNRGTITAPGDHPPGWTNRVTRLSIRELLTFDAAIGADFLAGTSALFIHGRLDNFRSPAAADSIFQRRRPTKSSCSSIWPTN